MSERERFAKWLSGRWTPAFSSERQQAMCEGWNARAELAADEKREAAERERALVAEVERLREAVMDAYHEGWTDGLAASDDDSCAPSREDEVLGWMASDVRKRVQAIAQHESKEEGDEQAN